MPFYPDMIANMVKMHSAKQDQSYGQAQFAKVLEYDPDTNTVKVGWYNPDTDDDDLISGWLPLMIPFIGRGDDTDAGEGDSWGLVYPPNIGQRVIVIPQHGDFNNGLVIGGNYSPICPPPQVEGESTQNGEFLLMHKTGSYLKFFNDGHVTVHTADDLDFFVDKDWNVTVKGDTTFNLRGNFTRTVAKDEVANVSGNQTLNLSGTRSDTIKGSNNLQVSGMISVNASGAITFTSSSVFSVTAPVINLD